MTLGVCERVGLMLRVLLGLAVTLGLTVRVALGVTVELGLMVRVWLGVRVLLGLTVRVRVALGLGVRVGVGVGPVAVKDWATLQPPALPSEFTARTRQTWVPALVVNEAATPKPTL